MNKYVVVEVRDFGVGRNPSDAVAEALRAAGIEGRVSTNDIFDPTIQDIRGRGHKYIFNVRRPDPQPVEFIKENIR